jgi:hypothetical protein
VRATRLPNKELTKPGNVGASQLISSVLPTEVRGEEAMAVRETT